jgi:hypothetical protein
MNGFVQKFVGVVKGVLNGFDRIVFKGSILPLMHDEGVMGFCRARGILNKEYKDWMQTQTAKVVDAAESYAKEHCGEGITRIKSSHARKEDIARCRQREMHIESGLIGVWSATESCRSYKARYCAKAGFPQLRGEWTKCKHLYFYFDHADFGFMNIRLQTWFPYHIQMALNGREWLRRGLERQGCDFVAKGNKFLHIGDYDQAQCLLDAQLDTRWERMLNGFLPAVFPAMKGILGPHLSYYWTLWQSEWATDLIFPTARHLEAISDSLLRHAFMTGTATRVLRYLDRPMTKAGLPYANMNNEVMGRVLDFGDGVRVRHWVDGNSVKAYNEGNNFRVETTMNQPGMFQVHRRAQGETPSTPKRRLPLRKGVADIALRAQISQDINNRFMDQLATCTHERPLRELFDTVSRPKRKDGRRVRALDLIGKDRALLQAISDPAFNISGITNKALREKLQGQPGHTGRTEKQLRAKVSRHLRLLRDHGLIRKMPRQFKYQMTAQGRELTTALHASLAASTQQLMKAAA